MQSGLDMGIMDVFFAGISGCKIGAKVFVSAAVNDIVVVV